MMKKTIFKNSCKIFATILIAFSCASFKPDTYDDYAWRYQKNYKKVTYTDLKRDVFNLCLYCHAAVFPNQMIYSQIKQVVVIGKPKESRLFDMVFTGKMPKGGKISPEQKQMIYNWIKDGAKDD